MKPTLCHRVALAALSILLSLPAVVCGQGSSLGSFTYQGRLNDASGPANGLFDFQFSLHPASLGTNNQIDTTITRQVLPVSNGLFTVTLSFPMAQDFHAAFDTGTDDKHIATVDADGVALAAIQELNQKLTDELKRRDAENTELKLRFEALERIILNQKSN